jgi:hypothetical protein
LRNVEEGEAGEEPADASRGGNTLQNEVLDVIEGGNALRHVKYEKTQECGLHEK